MTCDQGELEALASGELDRHAVDRRSQHVAGCARCAGELAWLRAERQILAERRSRGSMPEALWRGIEERIGPGRSTPRWSRRARRLAPVLGLAAAAAAIVWLLPRGDRDRPPVDDVAGPVAGRGLAHPPDRMEPDQGMVDAERAVAEAERAHLAAIDALERAYADRRTRIDPSLASSYDRKLRETREGFSRQRLIAGNDLDGRLLLLDAYSAHRRTLLWSLQELEVRR